MALEKLKDADGVNKNVKVAPVLVLCDTSGSMKEYVGTLQKCLDAMVGTLKQSNSLRNSVDLCIATFNADFDILLPFTRLPYVGSVPQIQPSEWGTYLGTAVKKAVELLAEEKEKLKAAGDYVQPALIILSDGMPEHEDDKVTKAGIAELQKKIDEERWNCTPILMGRRFAGQDTVLGKYGLKGKAFIFDSTDQASNIIAGIKFASASVRCTTEGNTSSMETLYDHVNRLTKMGRNHLFLGKFEL